MAMSMKLILSILFIYSLVEHNVCAQKPVLYNIRRYGAKRNQDIAKVLSNIWKEVVGSTRPSKILIPKGTWYLSQINIGGPNKAPVELNVRGTVNAPVDFTVMPDKKAQWITIQHVNSFTITGGGVFDGHGQEAWKKNDCVKNRNCVQLPINLSFSAVNNSLIEYVTSKDSKNFHVKCIGCQNVAFRHFTISAPGDSPNTDGIHVARSSNVNITDSVIKTGDDCVSIGDDTRELHIQNVACGPGHGISIGSLGRNINEKDVSGIYIKNCNFTNTENGVRIKTWPSAPAVLTISNLQFQDLIMENVGTPIDINQEYCPYNLCKKTSPSQIKISNVVLKNIRGTSATPEAVILDCSKSKPCENVVIGDIHLRYKRGGNSRVKSARSVCANVKPILKGKQDPPICAHKPF
ncbi:exopolygalacturonase-like [Andrographis paniculata]|uniref:exopolygalacturonase-like n=1 Tax=Andrographis paniculata TaxID=175694 RepID=UPI0021E8D5CF|nr:exopolygalacturonase-like [Andrographis paniculata]